MSLGSRIKERREQLGMTRQDLANQIGVTAQAIGNYETEYSTPKIELLYKLFQALDCDANYLYQDEMKEAEPSKELIFTKHEIQLIEKYRTLDADGTKLIDTVLDLEYQRCGEDASGKILKFSVERETGKVSARNGREISEDAKQLLKNLNF